tara:strand:- start:4363 stop:5421 length:1059 start_codon:yes stop_codon:yes gene_type:complete
MAKGSSGSAFPVGGLTFDDIQLVPQYSEVGSRNGEMDLSARFSRNVSLKIPLVSSPMDTVSGGSMLKAMAKLGGIGVGHRFCSIEEAVNMDPNAWESDSAYQWAMAIGVTGDYFDRAIELDRAGVNALVIDIAHGHHDRTKKALAQLKSRITCDIVAGNIATAEGARDLEAWGADGLRVGIGNGSLCTTRIQTGVGIPQVSALIGTVAEATIPIIADGGIRYVGDVAKAVACGAETVMLGSLLSGTKESLGIISRKGSWPNENLYKKYRGSASLDSKMDRGESKNVEGASTLVPYKGKVGRIVYDILDGLRSSMSYTGVKNLQDFYAEARYIKVSFASQKEARPHLLDRQEN